MYTKSTFVQAPPVSGVPPNRSNNSEFVGVVPAQTVSVASVPASGTACSVSVTVAVASVVQGEVASTV